jgi:hypothetical protein
MGCAPIRSLPSKRRQAPPQRLLREAQRPVVLVVQREAVGLRSTSDQPNSYRVPIEVQTDGGVWDRTALSRQA